MMHCTYLQRRITESADTLKTTIRHHRKPGLWFEPHIRERRVTMQVCELQHHDVWLNRVKLCNSSGYIFLHT